MNKLKSFLEFLCFKTFIHKHKLLQLSFSSNGSRISSSAFPIQFRFRFFVSISTLSGFVFVRFVYKYFGCPSFGNLHARLLIPIPISPATLSPPLSIRRR